MMYGICKATTGTLHSIAHARCQAFCGICSGKSTFMNFAICFTYISVMLLTLIYLCCKTTFSSFNRFIFLDTDQAFISSLLEELSVV